MTGINLMSYSLAQIVTINTYKKKDCDYKKYIRQGFSSKQKSQETVMTTFNLSENMTNDDR